MDEFSWIDALRHALGKHAKAGPYGIGDDAALLPRNTPQRVIATDMMVENVHFRHEWSSLEDIAYKLYASNASDMWAMGAQPAEWLLSIAWPKKPMENDARALAAGFLDAMQEWGEAPLIGGDTSSSATLTLSMTMIGTTCSAPWLRSDYRAGDALWIDGPVGLSAAGLAWLHAGLPADDAHAQQCIAQHRRPQRAPSEVESAVYGGIDISDGLVADLFHAARASNVQMILDQELADHALLTHVAQRLHDDAETAHHTVNTWQCGGGEDYVRVLGAPASPGKGWTRIGRIEAGTPSVFDERGVERQELHPMGWNHFPHNRSSTHNR